MEKIGIFGGSFNPPTIAHIEIAKWCLEKLKLNKVLFEVSNNPFKTYEVDAKTRYELLRLSILYIPNLEIDVDGIGETYMCDTVERLKKKNPDTKYCLIIGEDEADCFEKWKNWKELVKLLNSVVVLKRNSLREEENKYLTYLHDSPDFKDISATRVREICKSGEYTEDLYKLVPKEIIDQIREIYKDHSISL